MPETITVRVGQSNPVSATIKTGPAPMISYEVGGRVYRPKRVRGCIICGSSARDDIETQMMMGYSTRTIWEGLPEEVDLKAEHGWAYDRFVKRMSDHKQRGHMPFNATAARIQQEQRAIQVGLDLDEVRGSIIDYMSGLDTVIQLGIEQILEGATIKPTVTMAAIRTKAVLKKAQDGAIDNTVVEEAFSIFLDTARNFMDDDVFTEMGKSLAANPMLHALAEKVRRNWEMEKIDPRIAPVAELEA